MDPVSGRALAAGGTVLGVATGAAAAGNFALNLVLCRVLGAAEFAVIASVATITLFLSTLAAGIQLQVAAGAGAGWTRRIRRCSAAVAILGVALAIPLGAMLSLPPALLVITALGIPFHAHLAIRRGIEQGRLRFGWLGASLSVELVIRAGLTAGVVAGGGGALGAVLAVNVAFALTLPAMATWGSPPVPRSVPVATVDSSGPGGLLLLSMATAALTNADVLIVAAVLPAEEAGRYAAVAVIARAAFLIALTIQNVIVPAIGLHPTGNPRVARTGLLLTGAAALSFVAALAVVGGPLVHGLLPDVGAVDGAASHRAMTMLALAAAAVGVSSVAASTAATTGNRRPSIVLAGAAVCQPFVVLGAGASIASVATAQVLVSLTAAVLVGLVSSGRWTAPTLGDRVVLPIGTS